MGASMAKMGGHLYSGVTKGSGVQCALHRVGEALASGIPAQSCPGAWACACMSSGMQGAIATATCWNRRQNTATMAKIWRMPGMVGEKPRPILTRIKPLARRSNVTALRRLPTSPVAHHEKCSMTLKTQA